MSTKIEFDIDIQSYLYNKKSLIDNHLKKIFEESNDYKDPIELWDAVRYSLLDGGKRIRGILCLAAYESLLQENDPDLFGDCLTIACSIEIIHAMSLIHDDLPSMDNDDLRRGKPSCHKAFGEATAILAGDGMLSLAFELITEHTKKISETQKLEIISTLAKSFTKGLVPGQMLDLSLAGKSCDLKTIEKISRLKTAELIRASIICGSVIVLEDNPEKEKITKNLTDFGLKTGTAFQIIDDVLDKTSDTKTLGKTSHKDEKQKKLTYPLVIGIENSKNMARELIEEAKLKLKDIPIKVSLLSNLADYIINRIN